MINNETDPEILTKLGVMMARHNILICALDSYIKAMHVAPDYKDAYLNAGKLLANWVNMMKPSISGKLD